MTVAAAEGEGPEELFMRLVADVCAADPALTPVGAGLLAALHLGICKDSRTFSRLLGIAHALVLREVTDLSGRGLLGVVGRNDRTQRTEVGLTEEGQRLVSAASSSSASVSSERAA